MTKASNDPETNKKETSHLIPHALKNTSCMEIWSVFSCSYPLPMGTIVAAKHSGPACKTSQNRGRFWNCIVKIMLAWEV